MKSDDAQPQKSKTTATVNLFNVVDNVPAQIHLRLYPHPASSNCSWQKHIFLDAISVIFIIIILKIGQGRPKRNPGRRICFIIQKHDSRTIWKSVASVQRIPRQIHSSNFSRRLESKGNGSRSMKFGDKSRKNEYRQNSMTDLRISLLRMAFTKRRERIYAMSLW